MSTDSPTRTPRLAAEPLGNGAVDAEIVHVPHPVEDPTTQAQRRQRFAEGLRSLRVGGGTLRLGERTLMIAGGVVAPLGIIVVLLGWLGASQTPYVFEQVPYLISGGLLGLSLVFLGAFFYFAHWLTELVREHRAQSSAVVEALQRLQDQVTKLGEGQLQPTIASTSVDADGDLWVATARGTMAHRPDCVVVAGKADLRTVTVSDGLAACKLCDPTSA